MLGWGLLHQASVYLSALAMGCLLIVFVGVLRGTGSGGYRLTHVSHPSMTDTSPSTTRSHASNQRPMKMGSTLI